MLTLVYWVGQIGRWLLQLYILALIVRAVLSWVMALNPSWRTKNSVTLFLCNVVFGLTDPPLRFLSRFIKPLRLGTIALDLSFIVLFLLVTVLINIWIHLINALLILLHG
ncbi:MAG: YggT family protein [Varibaculum cambriense]|uniref:YggT family protein n=1 Tax=Varibaculum cambriense TaxID=184870 RepID=UPI0029145329|nr:YggT family protein [Varibaculum cambriense]MDU4945683.1 YggT family protein [Varibaculum cambriense]